MPHGVCSRTPLIAACLSFRGQLPARQLFFIKSWVKIRVAGDKCPWRAKGNGIPYGVNALYIQEIVDIMERHRQIYDLLKHCPYEILRQWVTYAYESGHVIFRQGDVQDSLFIVVEGLLDINVLAENGRKYSQATYEKGDLIGELEIFDLRPFVCNVEALTDVKLIGLKRDYFMKWIERDTHFSTRFMRELSALFYRLSEKAGEDSLYSLYHRICRFLVRSLAHGVRQVDGIKVTVDKHQLSHQFAVTPRSVNRILKKLSEQKIIISDNEELIVTDVDKLKREEARSRLI